MDPGLQSVPASGIVLSGGRWSELSPYLDEALDLDGEARLAWLRQIEQRDATLARELRSLLFGDDRLGGAIDQLAEQGFASEALAGTTWGSYRLTALVGQGGMGSVWRAERADGRFEGQVAIKLLNLAQLNPAETARLHREGSVLARLDHPHIARLLDAGVSPGQTPYLVLEYIQGQRIDRYCDEHRLDLRRRVALFLDVVAAVAHAHAHLVVHRDIKPSNVLVSVKGQVKLLDFGIAKLMDGGVAVQPAATQPASRLMTPEFAAPEQLQGATATVHTDVYALGVLLYVLLTGRHPSGLEAHTPAALVHATVNDDAQRASAVVLPRTPAAADAARERALVRGGVAPERLARLLAGDLDTILAKALKREPAQRYASAAALGDDLRRWLDHRPIHARADTLPYRVAKLVRRQRLAVAAACVSVAGVAAGLALAVHQAHVAEGEALRATAVQQFLIEIFSANRGAHVDPTRARLTTARELLDLGAARVDSAFATSPRARADVTGVLAGMYADLGLQHEAAALWGKAAEAERQEEQVHAGRLTTALLQQARAADLGGEPALRDRALEEAQRVLALQRQPALGQLALLSMLQARQLLNTKPLQAAELAQRAARQFSQAGDPAAELRALHVQGAALSVSSRWDDAATVLERALAAGARVPSHTPQDRVLLLGMLGSVRDYQGRRAESARLLHEGLALSQHANGHDHPSTAVIHLRLGFALFNLGRLSDAEAQARTAMQILERSSRAQDTFMMPDVLTLLGGFISDRGNPEEGLPIMRRGVSMRASQGHSPLALAVNYHNLAVRLVEAGLPAEAEQALQRADAVAAGVEGSANLDLSAATTWLILRTEQGEPQALRQALERQLELCRRTAARDATAGCDARQRAAGVEAAVRLDDPRAPQLLAAAGQRLAQDDAASVSPLETARLALLRGQLALRRGDPAAAAKALDEAVQLRAAALDADSLPLAHARTWLARAHLALGQVDRARTLVAQVRRAHAAHPAMGQPSRQALSDLEARLRGRAR